MDAEDAGSMPPGLLPCFPQVCEAHDPKISAAKVFVFAKQMLDAAEQVSGIRHGSLVHPSWCCSVPRDLSVLDTADMS